jgi:hypothetical protein
MNKIFLILAIFILQSCAENFMDAFNTSKKPSIKENQYSDFTAPTNQLNKTRELLDGASITFPTLTATGYAVVSTQPGQSRGARTVRINPTGSDTYETVLEIDQDMVAYLFRQAQSL